MSLLEQAPSYDAATAAQLGLDLFGVDAAVSSLPSERDQNFLLTTGRGDRFVLKIANAMEELPLLEAQNQALTRAANAGLSSTVAISRAGNSIERAPDGHYVRLLTWLDGRPLGDVTMRRAPLLENLGRRLGGLSCALNGFEHPAVHRPFHWNLTQALDTIRKYAPLVADVAMRGLVERTAAHVEARDAESLRRVRRSVIHGDVNDYNVIVDGDRISGFIDFGDLVHSYTVAEPAVACAYAMLDHPGPMDAIASVVRGYHAAFPLTDDELSVLFGLIQLRLCLSVSLAAHQQRQRPDDEYLAISQAPIARTLPRLAAVHPDAAEDMLRAACGMTPRTPVRGGSKAATLARRRERIGSNLSVGYREPVKVVRGWMQYLFDETGRRYLDGYNNVPHVGHAHPRIVNAAVAQLRAVNTNTRYLSDTLTDFADRLVATLPDPLRVCYFVNSGSEANELALRLARAHTGRRDVIVLDAAYHGNTTTLIEISPYKFNGPGGRGTPEWVRVAPIPDDYRGPFKRGDADAGEQYGDTVAPLAEGAAAFICETCPSVGGQVIPPPGYLQTVYRHVRAAGGVCIADEVQTAYGRMGTHFYAFEAQHVVPDIVVLGKPIGNGYPLGAVVTTTAIAESFANGMEFFSTFGGSTVSCAVGLEVLDVLEEEDLQAHALRVGERLLAGLRTLAARHEIIGDVRGSGLFIGVELVTDRVTLTPATAQATTVVERLREDGILIGTDGPFHNVLKIRPPMPFSEQDADVLLEALDVALSRRARPTA
jgi:4-aminobutyrate aminotransferase-like enzyme/Ser/Thr protein kinase RdoA (MazF antagonist)